MRIVRFLGTNCDRDVWQAVESVGLEPEWLWYQDRYDLSPYRGIVLPGGFSYGDYLRCGALAAKSPVMSSVQEAADKGIPVLGICNGFQVLCESGLLPGALLKNNSLRFIDKWSSLKLQSTQSQWTGNYKSRSHAVLPIAHGEGRYFISQDEGKALWDNDQVWWTYDENPNGSVDDIAGVLNAQKNVAGLMPHPERAMFDWMGGEDGVDFFSTMLS
ncbi:MAG: phosphoribosylformylglycinamidine synthase subunit PurQ [Bdellovibrionales bacterium]|nr:phosphoribosylformylglycinamidine synthase subunit PurQ [Bdellovibrionales bacterium]